MNYTAHPQGKRDNLPLISIFNEDGLCVATLTMDDIAFLYDIVYSPEKEFFGKQERMEYASKRKEKRND